MVQDRTAIQFSFDNVHGFPSGRGNTQAEVFTETRDIVQSVLHGFRGCIMAYGQTGQSLWSECARVSTWAKWEPQMGISYHAVQPAVYAA